MFGVGAVVAVGIRHTGSSLAAEIPSMNRCRGLGEDGRGGKAKK
jgi:hypothetical protein